MAIVADDLTGALDTATPFALRGLRVAAAVRPEALAQAVASGCEVVVVSTASRAVPALEAARRVASVGAMLAAARPEVVFKKIDSRLKGNVGAETSALAGSMGFAHAVAAPAIPDQQRPTIGGAVTGRGVDAPIAIAPVFDGMPIAVADAAADGDLDRIVASRDWASTLAVGARGLGAAFARTMGEAAAVPFAPDARTLFAIGSRDPITERQIDHLREANPNLAVLDAPYGELAAAAPALPAVLCSTGEFRGPDEAISSRFAAGVARHVDRLRPHTLVMGGGDTALAILERLGASLVFPQGEAAPGLPWFLLELANGHSMRCVVKSGGFGDAQVLSGLLPDRLN